MKICWGLPAPLTFFFVEPGLDIWLDTLFRSWRYDVETLVPRFHSSLIALSSPFSACLLAGLDTQPASMNWLLTGFARLFAWSCDRVMGDIAMTSEQKLNEVLAFSQGKRCPV